MRPDATAVATLAAAAAPLVQPNIAGLIVDSNHRVGDAGAHSHGDGLRSWVTGSHERVSYSVVFA